MFAAAHRLASSQDIERVMKTGARVQTEHAVIYSAPSPSGTFRCACIVGKKVHKSAVIRHRIQRRLREACKESMVAISSAYDIVVIAKKQHIQLMDMQEIVHEITGGIQKATS